jgi:hypothetical protein
MFVGRSEDTTTKWGLHMIIIIVNHSNIIIFELPLLNIKIPMKSFFVSFILFFIMHTYLLVAQKNSDIPKNPIFIKYTLAETKVEIELPSDPIDMYQGLNQNSNKKAYQYMAFFNPNLDEDKEEEACTYTLVITQKDNETLSQNYLSQMKLEEISQKAKDFKFGEIISTKIIKTKNNYFMLEVDFIQKQEPENNYVRLWVMDESKIRYAFTISKVGKLPPSKTETEPFINSFKINK